MSAVPFPSPQVTPVVGEPAWDVALLYPLQGSWSEQDYLDIALTQNWLVEYSNGCVEFLPMPTIEHQLIVKFLLKALDAFVESKSLGIVLFAPLPVWLMPKAYREPDLIFNFTESHAKRTKSYYESADLVMEVVSADRRSHARHYEDKRRDYAKAGIREYWIVDPAEKRITVLALEGSAYLPHGSFAGGDVATSRLLDGFVIKVGDVFKAAEA
jgi:Uma2 family endonuclease